MGDIPVYTRIIYLNKLFLHKQIGLQVFFESKEEFAQYFRTRPINRGTAKDTENLS
jgi:hypothetical protein